MNVLASYRRLMFVLVALGIVGYALADDDFAPAALALPIMGAAWALTSGQGARPLPRWLVNLLLVGATVHLVLSWPRGASDVVPLLCRYVIWLQLIKLFEPLTVRDQAQQLLLSLMLMIGAGLTSVQLEVGLVLLAYLPVLIVTVMQFQLLAAQLRAQPAGAAPQAPVARGARRMIRRTAALAVCVMLSVATITFVLFPRGVNATMLGAWPAPRTTFVTGFRDHIQLGSAGTLTESRRPVLALRVESRADQAASGRVYRLRGAVLDQYDPRKHLWGRSSRTELQDRPLPRGSRGRLVEPAPDAPLLTQHITLLSSPGQALFSVWRPVAIEIIQPRRPLEGVRVNPHDGAMQIISEEQGLSYVVTSWPQGATLGASTADYPFAGAGPVSLPDPLRHDPFARGAIHEEALRLLGRARVVLDLADPESVNRAAAAFQTYLRGLTYTTELVAPSLGQHPIEMFLLDPVRGRRGHCEYFASAMAALCRSVQIPARVINGYVASEYNPATQVYTVRESHAHSWVEVQLRPGRWVEFDPSPPAEIERLHQPPPSFASFFRRIADVLQVAWTRSVATYDQDRQARALRGLGQRPVAALRRAEHWIARQLGLENREQSDAPARRRELPAVRIAVVLGAALLAVAIVTLGPRVFRKVRLLAAMHRSPPGRDLGALGGRAMDDLYARLQARLRDAGLPKPAAQPPLDHLRELEPLRPALAAPARRLVELYYAGRFGSATPTAGVVAQGIAALAAFDLARRTEPQVSERPAQGQSS